MTKRERVIAALQHKESDIIPFTADFTEQEYEKMVRYTKNPEFLKTLDCHLNYTQYWAWPTEMPQKKERFRDEYGVIWNRSGADKDIGVVEEPYVIDLEDYNYTFPEINEKRLREEYRELLENKGDAFTFTGIGFSMYERAWSLCGIQNVLMDMVTNELELQRLLNDICEYNLKILDIALEYDFDAIYFGDDWGQQRGLIMGPERWRKFIKPNMKRMYDKVKEKGKFILQHSCGDVIDIFPDLIEIGLDCYQTFQPEIYDIEKVKKEYGSQLCFWGGISTQNLLPYASPEEVKKEIVRIAKVMKDGGGYIMAPTHALPPDVPPENVLAMFEVFQNQDKYGLK